jgi:hypothetical protein
VRRTLGGGVVWAAVACLVACGGGPAATTPIDTGSTAHTGGTAPAPSSSEDAPTTAIPSTTTPPTTAASITSTSTSIARSGFDPPCTEQEPTRAVPVSDEAILDHLGPIGVEPAIRIALPSGYSTYDGSLQVASSMTSRIPGGLLIAIVANSSGYFPGTMLVAVDHDGHLRWRRCLDERIQTIAAADAADGPEEALALSSSIVDSEQRFSWWSIALDDGRATTTLTDAVDRLDLPVGSAPLASPQNWGGPSVLGPAGAHIVDTDVDRLAVIDLVDMSAEAIPFPPEFDGHPADELQLDTGSHGELLRMGLASDLLHRVPNSVWSGGVWNTDPTVLRAAWPVTAGYGYLPSVDGG